jgi:hypothetical protein
MIPSTYLVKIKQLFVEESLRIFVDYSSSILTVCRTPIVVMNNRDLDGTCLSHGDKFASTNHDAAATNLHCIRKQGYGRMKVLQEDKHISE